MTVLPTRFRAEAHYQCGSEKTFLWCGTAPLNGVARNVRCPLMPCSPLQWGAACRVA